KVPARDQMHFRERRILRDVVRGENDQLPEILRYLVAVWFPAEESLAPFFVHMFELLLAVETGAGICERRRVHICRKNLHVELPASCGQLLKQEHGQRV